jgi:peptide deformylase
MDAGSLLTLPDKRLRLKSKPIQVFDTHLQDLAKHMFGLMEQGPGGVGLAAPQLGVLKRVIVIDCSLSQRPCRNHGRICMVNPEIISASGEVLGREGCLSVPEWVATVPRAKTITVAYQNVLGENQTLEASGFEARVIQHEIDHLDGILFIDRVLSLRDIVRRL